MKSFTEIFNWLTEKNRSAIDKLEFICEKMKELDDRARELQSDVVRCVSCGEALDLTGDKAFWSFWSKEKNTRMNICEKCFGK